MHLEQPARPSLITRDFYEVLNVPHHATDTQIRSAYRLLVRVIFRSTGSKGFFLSYLIVMDQQVHQWHPDRHATNKEEKARRFMEVSRSVKGCVC